MSEFIQVVTTAANQEEAAHLATVLVEDRLAACVQVFGPVRSMYHWQGKIATGQEWVCTVKSRRDLFDAIVATIRRNHSYEVPEILAVPIEAGNPDYLAWLAAELRPDRP